MGSPEKRSGSEPRIQRQITIVGGQMRTGPGDKVRMTVAKVQTRAVKAWFGVHKSGEATEGELFCNIGDPANRAQPVETIVF